MAQPTNTFSSYDAGGNREDLSDMVYDISPTETPFLSSIARGKATGTNHEWTLDSLAAAVDTNAVIEGDDATTDATSAVTKAGNYTQILDKVALVTGTQNAVDNAANTEKMDYQMAKRMKEIKRDLEKSLFASKAKVAGNDTTARVMAGVEAWLATNTSAGVGGADPAGTGADTRTDGTQRAFAEADLKSVLASAAEAGGDVDTLYVGSFNKQAVSAFSGNATRTVDGDAQKLNAAVHVYVSDFGELKVVFSRHVRSRSAIAIDHSLWALAVLRDFQSFDLAKTGDSMRKQIVFEGTLEARNEAGNGIIADLTTA